MPDLCVVKILQKLAWISAAGFATLIHAQSSDIHAAFEKVSSPIIEYAWITVVTRIAEPSTFKNLQAEIASFIIQ